MLWESGLTLTPILKMAAIRLTLTSGFTVDVTTLPPYYADFIDQAIPLQEYPRRKLKLLAGDTVEYEYNPPNVRPDPVQDPEEFELWAKWKDVEYNNNIIVVKRDRARRDFLTGMCVNVVSGPMEMDDPSWVEKLESSIPGYVLPADPGQRRLAFLKAVVITTQAEAQAIIQVSMYPEVDMQSIQSALHGFRTQMGQP